MTAPLSFLFWFVNPPDEVYAHLLQKELMERGSIKSLLEHPDMTFMLKRSLAIGAASGM
jgi:hypothetical protein